jgi:hypothetical protein
LNQNYSKWITKKLYNPYEGMILAVIFKNFYHQERGVTCNPPFAHKALLAESRIGVIYW